MQLTQGALGFLIKRYSAVLKKCHILNTFGALALAGALSLGAVGVAGAAEYDGSSAFAAGTDYDSTTSGPADTVVVNKNGAVAFDGAGTVTISATKGLEINGTAVSGGTGTSLTVGTAGAEILTITSGALTLTAGAATTANDATLTIDGTGAKVELMAGETGAIITGVQGTAGLSKVAVTEGTLGAYDAEGAVADLAISGPIDVTVTATDGILAAAGLTLDGGATLTNANEVTIDGVGGDNKLASLEILGAGSTYAGNLVVNADTTQLPALAIIEGTQTGTLSVTKGDVLLQKATAGTVTMTGGNIDITSAAGAVANETTTLAALTVGGANNGAGDPLHGGIVTVTGADLAVTNALTVNHQFAEFTLDGDSDLTAGSLAVDKGFVNLQGTAGITGASAIKDGGLLWVSGETTMTGELTVGNAGTPGGSVAVLNGGTLHLKKDSSTAGSGHLQVRQGGILKLDADKTLTVAGDPADSASAGMGRNVVLYDTTDFTNGNIAGKVDVTSGELAFGTAVDLTDILIDGGTADAANGKITIGVDGSDAGEVAARQGLTYKKDALALGHADATLMSGDFTLGDAENSTGDFEMTKGKLTAIGDITVGDGTGTLTLTADSSLDLIQAASESKTVGAGKIDVAAGSMNVLLGNWEVEDVTLASGGSLNVGVTDPTQGGEAGLTINGELDTATSTGGTVAVKNGTLDLAGTVNIGTDDITVGDLGQVTTDLSTAYDGSGLATGFGTVQGTGLLTLRNDSGSDTMTLADYKTLTSTLQSASNAKVGVTVEGLTITGTEGATLDSTPSPGGVNVEGVNLSNVVASVSETTVTLNNTRTDLKGLEVDNAGSATTITLGSGATSATLTLKGGASGFDLDAGGIADMVLANSSILNLGTMADGKTYGALSGDVTLSSATATLNAVNGDFSVGAVTATSGNDGVVKAQGANLTAESIGAVGTAVGSVEANTGGILSSLGDIVTQALVANGGRVQAVEDITVTNAVTGLNNGTILSETGNVTLTAGATGASGTIAAVEGSILTASNTSIAGTDLTLVAGADINVGSGNIEATTVSAQAGTITAADITATNVGAETLAATGNVELTDGKLILTGTDPDVSTVGGTLGLNNIQASVGDLEVTGVATIDGGSLIGNEVTLAGGGAIANGAQVGIASLILGADLEVGEAEPGAKGGTSLQVTTLNLAGHSLLLDPAWGLASTEVAVGGFSDNAVAPDASINGDVGVGMNSMLTVGTTDKAWLREHLNAVTGGAGLTENGVTAVMGLKSAQVLGSGNNVLVDGSLDLAGLGAALTGSNTVAFEEGSLLVVSADAALDPAGALSAADAGTVNVDAGAKLRIAGAEVGRTYTILGDNLNTGSGGTATIDGWSGANFSTDSLMIKGGDFDPATGQIRTALNSASNVYPKLEGEMASLLDGGYLAHQIGGNHVNAEAKGARFLSRATNLGYIGGDANLAAVTMEGAARMAVAGAVPQMTMAANNAMGNAVSQRTSLALPDGNGMQSMAADGTVSGASAGDAAGNAFAMWIMPLYQSSNGYGMKAGNFDMDYSGGLGGVAIGADYTFANAIRAGITFNIGGGYATGSGDFNETTNDMNFWGLGAYAGWAQNNFGVTADVNYTSTYNKLEQDLPSAMQMGKLKSDITAYAISAGLRGEYKFETSFLDITPHVGVRFMSLNTNEYDVTSGGDLLKGDGFSQSIWTFPIGVAFSKTVDTGNGWHVKPSLDLAVIPAAGDIMAKNDVRFTGVSGSASMETQTMDYISYMGQAGLEFGNENMSFGVNYNLQAGERSTAHGVFGTFRYEF